MLYMEEGFSPDAVTAQNLLLLAKEQSITQERRICELAELADAALDGAIAMLGEEWRIQDVYSWISSVATGFVSEPHPSILREDVPRIGVWLAALCGCDKAIFADLLLRAAAQRSIAIGEVDFIPAVSAKETIAYVRNAYADEAFEVFSQEFSDPRVRYVTSFKEAVKAVCDGDAGFCLLPLEEQGGGRLPSVETLLFHNDLKIASVTPVYGFEGNAELSYGLISRAPRIAPFSSEDDRYLEIRLPTDGELSLADLCLAAAMYDYAVYRVNTATHRIAGVATSFYTVVLKTEGRTFLPLLSYLTLFSSDYTPIGLYKNLEV